MTSAARVVCDVFEIGRRLTEAKQIAGHGNWLPWLEREFGWTDDTAINFMRVFVLSKSRNFRDLSLPVSGLYLLAAPSTAAEVQEQVIARGQWRKLLTAQIEIEVFEFAGLALGSDRPVQQRSGSIEATARNNRQVSTAAIVS